MRMSLKGFSIIELLVVVSIIVVLSATGLTIYANSQKHARDSKVKQDITSIANALEIHYGDTTCGAIASSYCAPLNSWFVAGIPQKPNGTAYTTLPINQATTYCICALLEKNTGNYDDANCTTVNPTSKGTYFCAKNRQ